MNDKPKTIPIEKDEQFCETWAMLHTLKRFYKDLVEPIIDEQIKTKDAVNKLIQVTNSMGEKYSDIFNEALSECDRVARIKGLISEDEFLMMPDSDEDEFLVVKQKSEASKELQKEVANHTQGKTSLEEVELSKEDAKKIMEALGIKDDSVSGVKVMKGQFNPSMNECNICNNDTKKGEMH